MDSEEKALSLYGGFREKLVRKRTSFFEIYKTSMLFGISHKLEC